MTTKQKEAVNAENVKRCENCRFFKEYYHGNYTFSAVCLWALSENVTRKGTCTNWKRKG